MYIIYSMQQNVVDVRPARMHSQTRHEMFPVVTHLPCDGRPSRNLTPLQHVYWNFADSILKSGWVMYQLSHVCLHHQFGFKCTYNHAFKQCIYIYIYICIYSINIHLSICIFTHILCITVFSCRWTLCTHTANATIKCSQSWSTDQIGKPSCHFESVASNHLENMVVQFLIMPNWMRTIAD